MDMNVPKTYDEFEADYQDLIAKHGLKETVRLIDRAYSAWVLADLPVMLNSESEWSRSMGISLRNRLLSNVDFLERHIETLEELRLDEVTREQAWAAL